MKFTDKQVAQEVADIENTAEWPLRPILPVKQLGHADMIGVMFEDNLKRVHVCSIFDLRLDEARRARAVMSSAFDYLTVPPGTEVLDFESTEALVRGGWVGD